MDENSLLSASFDGDLKLWKISNLEKDDDSDIKLQLQYSLINDANYSGQKPIFSACFYKDKIVFGDDGINLKVVHITKGKLSFLHFFFYKEVLALYTAVQKNLKHIYQN